MARQSPVLDELGRCSLVRAPNDKEILATAVLSFPLEEVSAKIRVGPPVADDEEDADLPVWAGVVPVALRAGPLQPVGPRDDLLARPALPRCL
jgi:hypothetical protein